MWEARPNQERAKQRYYGTARPCHIVRYADDFVVLIKGTREQAEQLKAAIATFLEQELHLELSAEKTLITEVERGIDFLGFMIRKYEHVTLITPSRKAVQRFRDTVKRKVWEGFNLDDVAAVVHINRYLIGWAMYYRRVSSSDVFNALDHYVWWRVFRTSHRLRSPKLTRRAHYLAHYIPYRYDLRAVNRRHKGRNYGVWADQQHSRAHIIVNLRFFPIRYVMLHPQLNPYVPEERADLEARVGVLEPPPDQRPGPTYHADYGPEWPEVRRYVLQAAGYRCDQCRRRITGRVAHVHHRVKRKSFKQRSQANLLDNLVALCPACHARAETTE